jgi:hypothetical protein
MCAGAVLAAACASSGSGSRPRAPAQPPTTQPSKVDVVDSEGFYNLISAAGTWRVSYRTEPSPIPLNEPFSVIVRIARSGTTVYLPDLPVRVNAGMPHHQHGMNRVPEHVRVSPEVVRADGLLFHMKGAWTLTFDVTEGAITERAEVVVEVP